VVHKINYITRKQSATCYKPDAYRDKIYLARIKRE